MKIYQHISLLLPILIIGYNKCGANKTEKCKLMCTDKENCTTTTGNSLCENSFVSSPKSDTVEYGIEHSVNLKPKSRKKRYVIFPEGSSFSAAACMTVGVFGSPAIQYLTWGMNWGMAYDLPNNSSDFMRPFARLKRSMPRPILQREYRFNLFKKMEIAINEMGYDGRECILRAVCESSQFLQKKGTNLIEELLRTVFLLPKTKVLPFEQKELFQYDAASRRGLTKGYCNSFYPNCGFSMIDLALGRYKHPDVNYV